LEIPDLVRDEPQFPLELTLSPLARDAIAESLAETNDPIGRRGVEPGGYLLGRINYRTAYVYDVTDAVHDQSPTHVYRDMGAVGPALDRLARGGITATVVGDWHGHGADRYRSASATPSDRDLACWLMHRDQQQASRWVGLIVTPNEIWGWQHAAFTVWCARREDRYPICEPAVVR
jgi:hypothetical protein